VLGDFPDLAPMETMAYAAAGEKPTLN